MLPSQILGRTEMQLCVWGGDRRTSKLHADCFNLHIKQNESVNYVLLNLYCLAFTTT